MHGHDRPPNVSQTRRCQRRGHCSSARHGLSPTGITVHPRSLHELPTWSLYESGTAARKDLPEAHLGGALLNTIRLLAPLLHTTVPRRTSLSSSTGLAMSSALVADFASEWVLLPRQVFLLKPTPSSANRIMPYAYCVLAGTGEFRHGLLHFLPQLRTLSSA